MGLVVDAYILTRDLVGASRAGKTTIATELRMAQEAGSMRKSVLRTAG